jgi:hypothetical protein
LRLEEYSIEVSENPLEEEELAAPPIIFGGPTKHKGVAPWNIGIAVKPMGERFSKGDCVLTRPSTASDESCAN